MSQVRKSRSSRKKPSRHGGSSTHHSRKSRSAKSGHRASSSHRLGASGRSARGSRRTHSRGWRHENASMAWTLTDLQFAAKSLGIPFGGLNKDQLVKKINRYK